MATFELPEIHENPEHWGPPVHNAAVLPAEFQDIPFAPFSKSDKIGRIADWNAGASTSDGRGPYGDDSAAGQRGGRGGARGGRAGRDAPQSYGAGGANAFAYFHGDDEASFSVVDNTRTTGAKRGGLSGFSRGGRGGARGGAAATAGRGGARGGMQARNMRGRGGVGGARGGRRYGFKDWDKPQRIREASVTVGPEWEVLEEIDFTRLGKLRLDVDDPEDISSYGTLYAYDKSYDRINSIRFERPLQPLDRIRYNPTTSDDPVIQEIAAKNSATVYMTDSILSLLMCATRSVYPWDITMVRTADGKVFLDKRDGGPFDFVTVNENAADPPMEASETKEGEKPDAAAAKVNQINTPSTLSLEATYVNQNFAFQVVSESSKHELQNANPFYSPEETEPLASCGYRYRRFDLSTDEEDPVQLVVRTEVDSIVPGANASAEPQYITIKTLNEFDHRAQGAGGAPDWRSKLDSQRGAVVATEMKNNSCKLARFAVQSILAGADNMKMGYISRANPRDASRHVILGTQWYKPKEFAAQMNVSLPNGWGIVRTIVDLARKAPEGKYVLVKDPNKPVIRLYSVPANWPADEDLDGEEEEEVGGGEEGDEQ